MSEGSGGRDELRVVTPGRRRRGAGRRVRGSLCGCHGVASQGRLGHSEASREHQPSEMPMRCVLDHEASRAAAPERRAPPAVAPDAGPSEPGAGVSEAC